MIYGDAGVSTYGHKLDAQLEPLRADGCAKIFRACGVEALSAQLIK